MNWGAIRKEGDVTRDNIPEEVAQREEDVFSNYCMEAITNTSMWSLRELKAITSSFTVCLEVTVRRSVKRIQCETPLYSCAR